MNKGINKAIIIGNIGSISVNNSGNNALIANISVATSISYKDQQGQPIEKTEWHKIVFFNKLAEIVSQYAIKGQKCYIEGRLQTRKWVDKNNVERYTTEIIGNEFQILTPKNQQTSNNQYNYQQQNNNYNQQQPQQEQQSKTIDDMDVPF